MLQSVNEDGDIWKCKKCDLQFNVEIEHTPPGFPGYKCKKCESTSNSRAIFRRHILTYRHAEKDYEKDSSVIRKKYYKNGYLDSKIKVRIDILVQSIYKDENVWKCKICDLKFKLKDYCLNHVEIQHKHPRFPG